YTSYPTVPYWNVDVFSVNDWKTRIKKSFDRLNEKEGVSIYIHLPFCESLCTFCGCNKYITKRHEVEKPYIDALLKEWKLYQIGYTSYPTVPYWNVDVFSVNDWKTRIKKSFDRLNEKEGVSIYIHLPFCESLCTFCGCNKYITKRHEVEKPYIDALLKEWKLY